MRYERVKKWVRATLIFELEKKTRHFSRRSFNRKRALLEKLYFIPARENEKTILEPRVSHDP